MYYCILVKNALKRRAGYAFIHPTYQVRSVPPGKLVTTHRSNLQWFFVLQLLCSVEHTTPFFPHRVPPGHAFRVWIDSI